MKKTKIYLALSSLVFIGFFAFFFANTSKAAPMLMFNEQCKVEVFYCTESQSGPTRQLCHKLGEGVSCTTCGESTTCPDDPQVQ